MSVGSTLKAAREARGLSAEDIADQTHIFIQVIEKIEADDFSRIPAPVYGRGFIKHYAECVGLDPEPLVAEFMEAYTGKKPAVKPAAPAPQPRPPAPPPQVEEVPPVADVIQDEPPAVEDEPPQTFAEPPQAEEMPPISDEPPPAASFPSSYREDPGIPPSAMDLPLFAPPPPAPPSQQPHSRAGVFSSRWAAEEESEPQPQAPARKPRRQAHDLRKAVTSASHSIFSNMGRLAARSQRIPPAFWRYSLLAIGGIILLFGIVKGCSALYRLTESDGGQETQEAKEEVQPAESTAPAATAQEATAPAQAATDAPKPLPEGKLRSTGEKIPSLYID